MKNDETVLKGVRMTVNTTVLERRSYIDLSA